MYKNNLLKLRKEAKLKATTICTAMKVSNSTFCAYEKGNRCLDPYVALELAKFYNVTVEALYTTDQGYYDVEGLGLVSASQYKKLAKQNLIKLEYRYTNVARIYKGSSDPKIAVKVVENIEIDGLSDSQKRLVKGLVDTLLEINKKDTTTEEEKEE